MQRFSIENSLMPKCHYPRQKTKSEGNNSNFLYFYNIYIEEITNTIQRQNSLS